MGGTVETQGGGEVLLQDETPGLREEKAEEGGVEEREVTEVAGTGGEMVEVGRRVVVVTDQVGRHGEVILAWLTHHTTVVA